MLKSIRTIFLMFGKKEGFKSATEEFTIDTRKGMPVLLTLPGLELERSFDIKRKDNE